MIREIKMNVKNKTMAALIGLGMIAAPAMASADGLKDKLGNLSVSGFVDASASGSNLSNTNGSKNRGFGLDQVELDIEYHEGNVGLRFDLNASPSASTANQPVTQDGLFEQGYMTYTIPSVGDEGLTFTFGKFNAPIGWELLDAPDMYQFSHALVFNYGLPTNLTGAMVSSKVGMFDASVYWTNGTDVNGSQQNGMKTFGGRFGVSPLDGLNIGISYLQDKNRNNTFTLGNPSSTITDIDLTYDGIENLLIGAEYNENKGFQNDTTVAFAGPVIRSRGYMIMSHYDFSDMFGATVRYDYFDFDRSKQGKSTAYTGAITAALGGGLGALVEVRSDKNGANVVEAPVGSSYSIAPKTSVISYAFEMTYGF